MSDFENKNSKTPEQTDQQSKKSKGIIWIILFAVALIAAIIIAILYMNTTSEVKVLQQEKQEQKVYFQQELDSMMIEHGKIKVEYGELADSLVIKDSIITANAVEIKKLLNTKWEYYRVQKKLKQLRKISQGYLVQIDSLYRVNQQLQIENKEIKNKYRKEIQMTKRLTEEKDVLNKKVADASILRVFDINARGIKSTLFSNERTTDKANRTDKFKICFTVEQNDLATLGERVLFFRIAGPNGKILTPSNSEAYTFSYEDEVLQYTAQEIVNYQGESFRKCIYWSNPNIDEKLESGQYTIDIYTEEGGKLSQTYVNLK